MWYQKGPAEGGKEERAMAMAILVCRIIGEKAMAMAILVCRIIICFSVYVFSGFSSILTVMMMMKAQKKKKKKKKKKKEQ